MLLKNSSHPGGLAEWIKGTLRPIGLSALVPIAGFALVFGLELILKTEITKLWSSIINLITASVLTFVIFPRCLGIPFGKIDTNTWLKRLGFYLPEHAWKHILLGFVLAGCTLSGMLIASLLSGKYTLDWDTVNTPHSVFSLNPALWEELFYRGVVMILLLETTGSLKRAFGIQVLIFGLMHIKGFSLWSFVDAFSVIVLAVGYTYAAYKTHALVAGIVSHYFHDALLFLVQLPKDVHKGISENVTFYAILWVMVALGCAITTFAADKLGVCAAQKLYSVKEGQIAQ